MFYLPDGKSTDRRLEDLLASYTDALLTGQPTDQSVSPRLAGLDSDQTAEAYSLLKLASRLRDTLVPVDPSEDFVARLKLELVGEPARAAAPTLLRRWQRLPAGYRVAASLGGLTLTAGLALLAAGRVVEAVTRLNRQQPPKQDPGLTLNTVS